MTLSDLADASGVSASSLSRYERGCDVPASALQRIAEAMDVDRSVLLDQPDKMPRVAELELRLEHAEATVRRLEKESHRKDILIGTLAFIVIAALLALLVDLSNPNVGWIRAAAAVQYPVF